MALLLCLLAALSGPEDLQALAEAGLWEDLIAEASCVLEAEPDHNEARYWLGRAWLERAQGLRTGGVFAFAEDLAGAALARAVEHLTQVRAVPGEVTADAADWAFFARFEAGGGQEALAADLERAWAQHGSAYAAFLRGRLEAQGERFAAAAEWLGRSVAGDPQAPAFALEWADALAAEGRLEEALQAWQAALQAGAVTDVLAASALRLCPGAELATRRLELLEALLAGAGEQDAWLAWYRAHALQELGHLEQAAAVLARARQEHTAEVGRFHAWILTTLDRRDQAAALLLPWVEQGDEGARAGLLDLADDLGRRWAWDEALSAYDAVLRAEPRSERALRNRALTLARAGREQPARAAYEALVQRWPERPEILNEAALAALGRGDRPSAQALLERAVGLYGSLDARENLARLLLTGARRDPARARKLLGSVLAAEPDRDRTLYLRFRAARVGSD